MKGMVTAVSGRLKLPNLSLIGYYGASGQRAEACIRLHDETWRLGELVTDKVFEPPSFITTMPLSPSSKLLLNSPQKGLMQ